MSEYKYVKVVQKGKRTKITTPKGIFRWPAFVTPDVYEEGDDPKFKTGLLLDAGPGEELKEALRQFAEEATTEWKADTNNKKYKNYEVYVPGAPEEDEDGEETGRWVFNFSTFAFGKNRDGKKVRKVVPLFDAKGNRIAPGAVDPWGGTVGRVSVAPGAKVWSNAKAKECGITFYMESAQIIKLVESGAGERNAEDEGYDEEDGDDLSDREAETTEAAEDVKDQEPEGADDDGSGDLDDEIPF